MAPGGVAADVERRVWDPVVEGTILAIVASTSTTSSSETVPSVGDGDRPHRKTPPRWTRSVGESSPRMESGRESGESGARRWAGRRGEGDGDGDGELDGLRRTSDFDGWTPPRGVPVPRGRGRGWIFVPTPLKRGVVVFVASVVGGAVGGVLRASPPVATARARRRIRAASSRHRDEGDGAALAVAARGRGRGGGVGDTRGPSEASSRRSPSTPPRRFGAPGRRRHRVGTRCNHTPRRRTRGGGDGRARGGRSRRRARNPRCSRYARNRGSAARASGCASPAGKTRLGEGVGTSLC